MKKFLKVYALVLLALFAVCVGTSLAGLLLWLIIYLLGTGSIEGEALGGVLLFLAGGVLITLMVQYTEDWEWRIW